MRPESLNGTTSSYVSRRQTTFRYHASDAANAENQLRSCNEVALLGATSPPRQSRSTGRHAGGSTSSTLTECASGGGTRCSPNWRGSGWSSCPRAAPWSSSGTSTASTSPTHRRVRGSPHIARVGQSLEPYRTIGDRRRARRQRLAQLARLGFTAVGGKWRRHRNNRRARVWKAR